MEDLLYEAESVRRFVGLNLTEALPDETTILAISWSGTNWVQGLLEGSTPIWQGCGSGRGLSWTPASSS